MTDLTADECHVLLDCIAGYRPNENEPWNGYATDDPAEDPKTTEAGWRKLVESAEAKITETLNTL